MGVGLATVAGVEHPRMGSELREHVDRLLAIGD
jgi:hypothetical protein